MMNIKMYCGEHHGYLKTDHLETQQWAVRWSVGMNYNAGKGDTEGWKLAKKDGWKVVAVEVRKMKAAE